MPYQVRTDSFVGPFGLLLELIEGEELQITAVSLAKVTDEFLQYIDGHPELPAEELADFLIVAAKLLYLKSKELLPEITGGEEEGLSLEEQLKMYREYVRAAEGINGLIEQKHFLYPREEVVMKREPGFYPPSNLHSERLREIFAEIIERLKPFLKIPEAAVKKTISIKEKIAMVRDLLGRRAQATFRDLLGNVQSKTELVVTFLALLELVKQRSVIVEQDSLFDEMVIKRV